MNNSLGLYIHVPFCDGKCNYCDFYSIKSDDKEIDDFVGSLLKSISFWSEKLKGKSVDTVYFGGGTPSLLGNNRIIKILNYARKAFKFDTDCEITLEANPSSADNLDFAELKYNGINRVSLGMQSAIDEELKLLGRRHSREDVLVTVDQIKKSGISNISLDVMLGIPEQTKESLIKTLDFASSLCATHISTYLLTIEPNTVFGKERNRFQFASDDLQAELYLATSEYLKSNGYEHYEISNFCKYGLFSKHNMRYWQLKDYLGLGPSAHSLVNGKRFYYPRSVEAFKNNQIVEDGEGNTAEEYIMLMLRTKNGLNINEAKRLYGIEFDTRFFQKVKLYEANGYIENDGNSIRLTEKGFLLSNTVIADLI
ncbi:MAG: radical SAM family heme chaperone HemW [Clostridia bacterium]|nr:radical SAM family heme chaperone HemW [Clostridia bacterium]